MADVPCVMRVLCGWCGRHLYDTPTAKPEPDSHGICPACAAKVLADYETWKETPCEPR